MASFPRSHNILTKSLTYIINYTLNFNYSREYANNQYQASLSSSSWPAVAVSTTFSSTSTNTTTTVTSSSSSTSMMGTGYSRSLFQSTPSISFSSQRSSLVDQYPDLCNFKDKYNTAFLRKYAFLLQGFYWY